MRIYNRRTHLHFGSFLDVSPKENNNFKCFPVDAIVALNDYDDKECQLERKLSKRRGLIAIQMFCFVLFFSVSCLIMISLTIRRRRSAPQYARLPLTMS